MELAQTYEKVNPDDTRWPYIFYYPFATGAQTASPYLRTFLSNRKNASFAEEQKFCP